MKNNENKLLNKNLKKKPFPLARERLSKLIDLFG